MIENRSCSYILQMSFMSQGLYFSNCLFSFEIAMVSDDLSLEIGL